MPTSANYKCLYLKEGDAHLCKLHKHVYIFSQANVSLLLSTFWIAQWQEVHEHDKNATTNDL